METQPDLGLCAYKTRFKRSINTSNNSVVDHSKAVCLMQCLAVYIGRVRRKAASSMRKMCVLTSSYACVRSHPGLCYPLIDSIVSSNSGSAQSDPGLRCPCTPPKHIFAWWGSFVPVFEESLSLYYYFMTFNTYPASSVFDEVVFWILNAYHFIIVRCSGKALSRDYDLSWVFLYNIPFLKQCKNESTSAHKNE